MQIEVNDADRTGETTLPTLEQLLTLQEVIAGRPEVLTGADELCRSVNNVRGVHISELSSMSAIVEPGDLVLTTGVALVEDNFDFSDYPLSLGENGAAGLIVKLSRRFHELPPGFIDACRRQSLPLIVLHEEVSLVRIAEAMVAVIMTSRFAALRASEEAHATFTRLSIEGASVAEIVEELSAICRCPAVFENLTHHVMAFAAADVPVEKLLDDWKAQSRQNAVDHVDIPGWYALSVEARGRSLGRLIILPTGRASTTQRATVERAAAALVLNRMLENSNVALERHVHQSTLLDIVHHRFHTLAEMEARTSAVGFPTRDRHFTAVVVKAIETVGRTAVDGAIDADAVAGAVRTANLKGLVATNEKGQVAVLLSLASTDIRDRVLARFAEACRQVDHGAANTRIIACAGSSVSSLFDAASSLAEARDVACAAGVSQLDLPYYEPRHVQLRGLMHLLRADPHVQSFVERTVGPLLDYDYRHSIDLIGVLRAFLAHNGNKSIAADAAHISRHTFYRRIATAQRILGMELDSSEVRCSLYAAIMALDSQNLSERHAVK